MNNSVPTANNSIKWILTGGLIVLLALLVLFVSTSRATLGEKPRSFAELGGDFTLQSLSGAVSLSDFQGKIVVMYFGFLTCPEVCPNSMGIMAGAVDRLPKVQRTDVELLLVSIDPGRDTLQKLASYADYFHPNLTGVTGSKTEIDAVTRQYGAYYNFTDIESVTEDYGVEHSSRYYVMDRNGKLIAAMRHGTTVAELTAQISELL